MILFITHDIALVRNVFQFLIDVAKENPQWISILLSMVGGLGAILWWMFSFFVQALPEPKPSSSFKYIFFYRYLHLLAANKIQFKNAGIVNDVKTEFSVPNKDETK